MGLGLVIEGLPSLCELIPIAYFSRRSMVPLIGGGIWWPWEVNVANGYSAMDDPAGLCALTCKRIEESQRLFCDNH